MLGGENRIAFIGSSRAQLDTRLVRAMGRDLEHGRGLLIVVHQVRQVRCPQRVVDGVRVQLLDPGGLGLSMRKIVVRIGNDDDVPARVAAFWIVWLEKNMRCR